MIVAAHRRKLVRDCARIVGESDAEEAVQEALLKAYEALNRGLVVRSIEPWLRAIARNAALDLLRTRPRTTELRSEARGIRRVRRASRAAARSARRSRGASRAPARRDRDARARGSQLRRDRRAARDQPRGGAAAAQPRANLGARADRAAGGAPWPREGLRCGGGARGCCVGRAACGPAWAGACAGPRGRACAPPPGAACGTRNYPF